MCGCVLFLTGLALVGTSRSGFGQMIGMTLIMLSVTLGWAGRLTGRRESIFRTGPNVFDRQQQSGRPQERGPFARSAVPKGQVTDDATDAFFAILGMIAKADGRVSEDEIRSLDPLLPADADSFGRGRRDAAVTAFRRGRDREVSLQDALQSLFGAIPPARIDGLFDLFCRVAIIDGTLADGEHRLLAEIESAVFGTTARTERLASRYRARPGGGSSGPNERRRAAAPRSETDPHDVFGLPNPTTRDAIKKRYRELVKQHHPDRVRGRGVPEEAVRVAEQEMRKINIARDQLLDRYG